MVFLVCFGAYSTWDALAKRPDVYEKLKERGVQADASVQYHEVGLTAAMTTTR